MNGLSRAQQSIFVAMKNVWRKMSIKPLKILVKERHISQEEAETILRQMKQRQRYQRDVY